MIRKYRPEDCLPMAELFCDTVHTIAARDYTPQQLQAWAPGLPDVERWNQSFLEHHTLVAEIDGHIVGFADMDESGYLDRLYVHKDYQRQGVATALCNAVEQACESENFTTHASVTARSFFERRGYLVVREQEVERYGVLLKNYAMAKRRK